MYLVRLCYESVVLGCHYLLKCQQPQHTGFIIEDNITDRSVLENRSSDRHKTNTLVLGLRIF